MSESEQIARAALERLLAAAEARLPAGTGDVEPIRYGLLSARFVADECREALAESSRQREK